MRAVRDAWFTGGLRVSPRFRVGRDWPIDSCPVVDGRGVLHNQARLGAELLPGGVEHLIRDLGRLYR